MKRFSIFSWALLLFFVFSGIANATLYNRGGGLIYDDNLDITWLWDANYVETTGYDDALYGSDRGGGLMWSDAMEWAENLEYGGYRDWRLPSPLNQDGSGPCGGPNCSDSEMGHLYYTAPPSGLGSPAGGPLAGSGPFENIQNDYYWTNMRWEFGPTSWTFNFRDGRQSSDLHVSGSLSAWAVRDGDSTAPVPEPATMLLFGVGLAGLAGYRRRQAMKK